jgi:hypothetical protein
MFGDQYYNASDNEGEELADEKDIDHKILTDKFEAIGQVGDGEEEDMEVNQDIDQASNEFDFIE